MSGRDGETWCVWVAYYADRSAVHVFDNELDALRHAVDTSKTVRQLTSGDEL